MNLNTFEEAISFPDFLTVVPHISVKYNLIGLLGGDTIYHYTDVNALKNILETRTLWASNVNFQNDSKEINEGLELIDKLIDHEISTNPNRKDFLLSIKQEIRNDKSGTVTNQFSLSDIFSISFCTDGDLLSQWRGYGGFGGIAIGFNNSKLCSCNFVDDNEYSTMVKKGLGINASSLSSLRGFTTKVVYDSKIKEDIVHDILNIALKSTFKYEDGIVDGIVSSLKYLIPLMKNNSFSEEKEIRFIRQFDSENAKKAHIDFRIRNDIILPYIKLKLLDYNNRELQTLPIIDIVVGPSRNQKYIINSIIYYLDKNGLDYLKCAVRGSQIPIRE